MVSYNWRGKESNNAILVILQFENPEIEDEGYD